MSLKGRIVVVTGASSGIGASISRHLAVDCGATVVMGARREEKLTELAVEIAGAGGKGGALRLDVTDKESVKDFFGAVIHKFGQLDVLVNNAGVMYYDLVENANTEQWESQVNVNCNGMLNCIAAVIPAMISRKSGHIVNISSDSGRYTIAGLAVYTGTKYFVEGFSGALRKEVAEHNIKVTNIQPGNVKSELHGHSTNSDALAKYQTDSLEDYLEADAVARAVAYALTQPTCCAVNEILVQPVNQPC